jgi:hypothetical protein
MATTLLPSQSVRLSSAGFNKIYADLRHDPTAAKIIADYIEEDPKGALAHVFRLTKRQAEAIAKTTKADLLRRAKPLVEALRSEEPANVRFDPNADRKAARPGGGENAYTCTCAFYLPVGRGAHEA